MKTIKTLAILFAVAMLAACQTPPRSSTIENGKVSNLTSAEAATLAAKDVRQKKVAAVIKDMKPIFKMESFDGQPITINAKSFEVNVPLDLAVLMQEEAPMTSEEVQQIRATGDLIQKATPAMLGVTLAVDRNNARKSATELAEVQAGVDKAEIAADAEEAAAQRETLAAANAATLAAQKEAEAARLAAAMAGAGSTATE